MVTHGARSKFPGAFGHLIGPLLQWQQRQKYKHLPFRFCLV